MGYLQGSREQECGAREDAAIGLSPETEPTWGVEPRSKTAKMCEKQEDSQGWGVVLNLG